MNNNQQILNSLEKNGYLKEFDSDMYNQLIKYINETDTSGKTLYDIVIGFFNEYDYKPIDYGYEHFN